MYQSSPDHNAVLPGRVDAAWKTDVGDRTNGGLAIAAGSLYVDTFGQKVLALDARTGAIRWQTPVDNIAMSTPIVAEGLVFVGTGKNEMGNTMRWARAEGDREIAFDASTGTERWSFKTAGEDMPSPAYVRGSIVFANGDAHAYALDAQSGKVRWSRALPGIATMASANVIGADVLLSICTKRFLNGMTLRLRGADGAVVWSAPYGNCDSAPALGNGRVYVSGIEGLVQPFGFGGRGVVAALDVQTGKPAWIFRSPRTGYDVTAGSAERAVAGTYADGTYYQSIPDEDLVIAFDARSGAPRWTLRTLAPVKMSPLVVRGRLLFGDGAGLFYTVGVKDGRVLQTHMFRDGFSTSPPVALGNTLYLSTGHSIVATGLIHYSGMPAASIPHLLSPQDVCLSEHNCPH
jgi:outer membrane protein assembly factor BamB